MLTYVAPGRLTLLIATLSLIEALILILAVCDEVETVTVVLLAVKFEILGGWLSVLVMSIVILDVELFPAASLTVNVSVSAVSYTHLTLPTKA